MLTRYAYAMLIFHDAIIFDYFIISAAMPLAAGAAAATAPYAIG